MSETSITSRPAGSKATFGTRPASAARIAADWLCLAATPTFAAMALLAARDQPDIICAAMRHMSPLSGMVPMYLLMSVFHAVPWLKLICRL